MLLCYEKKIYIFKLVFPSNFYKYNMKYFFLQVQKKIIFGKLHSILHKKIIILFFYTILFCLQSACNSELS